MFDERLTRLSRQLLILALAASAVAAIWAARTPVAPNSDRYDYAGRARHLIEGQGPTAIVSYPLRFAFDGARSLPPENITRPPLWPVLLAVPSAWGLEDRAGVVLGLACLVGLLTLVRTVTDRSLGPGAGGFAALAIAGSFATTRALWGGGPELALTALTLLLWSWAPAAAGTLGYLSCGASYALLAWLHPIGIFYGGLAFVARSHRYSRRGRILVALTAVVLAAPWYVQAGRITHTPMGPLQSQAEMAKAALDPGGLGPYRGLQPLPTLEVLREHSAEWLRETRHRLRLHLQWLDAWWSWPLVLLSLFGLRQDPSLARRDLAVGAAAVLVVAGVSFEARLLLPLLPVAASWSGAGFRRLCERWPRLASPSVALVLVGAPWLLPLGSSARPGAELSPSVRAAAEVPAEALQGVGDVAREGGILFVDTAVLAYRSHLDAILVPTNPATMGAIAARLGSDSTRVHVVLASGRESAALKAAPRAWQQWLDRAEARPSREAQPRWVFYHPRQHPAPVDTVYVPPQLSLPPDRVPEDLVEIPVPPAARTGLRLRRAAWDALRAMLEAARAEGVELRVISAYRSWHYQKTLFDRAVERHGSDQAWVAAPGRSEHQLGTAVDLADAELEHQVDPSFADTPEGKWLEQHCRDWGFVLSYTPENQARSGYRPEPWHIRYRNLGLPEDLAPDASRAPRKAGEAP